MATLPFPPDPSYPLTISSTPDASSHSSTSPTPETTPIPAANHLSSSPASAGPSACGGRSKAQRWCEDGAAGAAGVGAVPAHAAGAGVVPVGAGVVPAGAGVVPAAVGVAPSQNRRSYRDALVSSQRPVSRVAVVSAGGGWETVQSRRGRRLARRPPQPEPRPVPVDLRGRCFNCFSADHRAARCSNRVRCFFCRRRGHRVSECPRRQTNLVALQTNLAAPVAAPVRRLVWRPISKETSAAVSGADHAMAGAGGDHAMAGGSTLGGSDVAISGKRRTRRGQRKRRAGTGGGLGGDPLLLSSGNLSPAAQDGPRPVRFIGRSRMIDRAELELRHALIVSVVGQEGTGCATEVREALASRFGLDADALRLRRAAPGSFIVLFPSEELAGRVFSGGPSLFVPPLRLHIKRWTRQAFASGGSVLSSLIDVELRGIPAHLWGLETAEGLHPDSTSGEDLSVIRLSAWCRSPVELPEVLDLHAVEPAVPDEDEVWIPRSLVFPVFVKIIGPEGVLVEEQLQPPPSDPSDDEPEQSRRARRVQRLGDQASLPRTSVHSRLGPRLHSSSTRVGPSDDVELLDALMDNSDDVAASVSSDSLAEPVDAPTLPCAAVEKLAAPGVLALCDVVVPVYSPDGASADLAAELREDSLLAVSCVVNTSSARWNLKPPVFKVYSRRLRPSILDDQDGPLVQSGLDNSMVISSPLCEFQCLVTKPVDALLPTPQIPKRRKKPLPSNFIPRRSRRVAKFPPELGSEAAAQDGSNYAELFVSGLSSVHIAALAALFGWTVLVAFEPDCFEPAIELPVSEEQQDKDDDGYKKKSRMDDNGDQVIKKQTSAVNSSSSPSNQENGGPVPMQTTSFSLLASLSSVGVTNSPPRTEGLSATLSHLPLSLIGCHSVHLAGINPEHQKQGSDMIQEQVGTGAGTVIAEGVNNDVFAAATTTMEKLEVSKADQRIEGTVQLVQHSAKR
ncbi:hypothetical protein ZEAMMB73_Zm00001d023716 [Zea mays]|uniref:Uncharacterized protein n=1 Tax=Zea mays TaxID=4577 RepID=A0A1D6IV43_MAIZE|nr:hypothetical protein ZEAMMB73_Zm00001d023716 [Zea mays]